MTRMSFRAAAAIGTTALAAAALAGTTATATPDRVAGPTGSTVTAASALTSADAKVSQQAAKHGYKTYKFKMVRSPGVVSANCIPKAKARVSITAGGQNEVMKTGPRVSRSPGPDFPFGLWFG